MARYLVNRVFHTVIVLLVVSVITFIIISIAPGGPAILMDPSLPRQEAERIRHLMGLDQPIYVQYYKWLLSMLQGDLGRSLNHGRPVFEMVFERFPATLLLAAVSLFMVVVFGIVLGVVSALRPYSWIDHLVTVTSLAGISLPSFWLGIMLIIFFSVTLRVLPSSGMYTVGASWTLWDWVSHLIMPSFTLAITTVALVARFARSSMLEVLGQAYITTARSKGLPERLVLTRHALKNGMIPVVTVIGLLLPRLVGGSAVVESVFAWPGMGRLAVDAAFQRDYPVVMGITMVISVAVILSNLLVDMAYMYIDPRIKLD